MYIERNADRQLQRIIENMGRPGYVLVARQMGKTNLLLNAKRNNSGSNNTFAYLDVSNQFPDLRSFFRNIVDTIIETSSGAFDSILDNIAEKRITSTKFPHKEHESELLEILRSTSGKLTICLDEIDALTKSSYSDQVFSFIRSVYFSGRSNFAEFNRITYILSGVAEPADIIKNKDISPFNIGEKIYLDDFSQEEASQLIKKSSLPDNSNIHSRVFWWANGHPRITWDIGSELEDLVAKGEEISIELVDAAVSKLYFSEVDNPPIDHIKRLAAENQEIRDALISIHYDRSESLSESVRTKLYLAGVTKGAPRQGPVEFKNKIVEDSLTESFLLSLPSPSATESLDRGIADYNECNYVGAISHFRSLIKSTANSLVLTHSLWLAKALYRVGEYEMVKDALNDVLVLLPKNPKSKEELEANYLSGATSLRLDLYRDALEQLSMIISNSEKTPFYYEAAVDYLTASLALKENKSLADNEILCNRLIAERSSILGAPSIYRSQTELFALLHYLLAQIFVRKHMNDRAASLAGIGIEFASLNTKILLLILLYDCSTTASRQTALHQSIALLKHCKGFAESTEGKDDIVSIQSLYDILSRLSSSKKVTEIADIFNHIKNESKAGLSEAIILRHLSDMSLVSGDTQVGSAILEALFSLGRGGINSADQRYVLRSIILTNPKNIVLYARRYFNTFDESNPTSLDDLVVLNNIAVNSMASHTANIAATAIDFIKKFLSSDNSISEGEMNCINLLFQYLEILQSFTSHPSVADIASARAFFSKISSFNDFALLGFQQNHPKQMQSNLATFLRKYGSLPTIKRGQKIGRNELVTVKYGELRRFGKFKKYEEDIQNGSCELVGKGIID